MNASSFHELAAALQAEAPMRAGLGLGFVQRRIDVRSNSPQLIETLAHYYREFRNEHGPTADTVIALQCPECSLDLDYALKQPEPGKQSPKEQFFDFPEGRLVRKVKTGMVFLLGSAVRLAVGPCLENTPQVVNFINNTFIEAVIKQGALLFHAAGVARSGKGLCIAGFSGAGKSTLALEIMRRGAHFVSNDRIMAQRLGGRLQMTGVPKMPRVNPGTVLHNPSLWPVMPEDERRRFQALPQERLWDLEHKYDADIDTCFGPGRFTLRSEMNGLVVLRWQRDSAPLSWGEVSPRGRRELLPAFMKSVGLFFEADDPAQGADASEEDYLKLLEDCPVLEFTGGIDFPRAADISLEFLERHAG